MAVEIVCVGYVCPLCGDRVAVLKSSAPPPMDWSETVSTCRCGNTRKIKLDQIQQLNVWRERGKAASA